MYAIVDIESTGGGFKGEKIIDVAIFVFDGAKIVNSYTSLVNPGIRIPSFISKLTGIKDKMVKNAPYFGDIAENILEITKDCTFVAHNVQYDYGILKNEFRRLGHPFNRNKVCTVELARAILPEKASYSLGNLCKELGIEITDRHRAKGDARATVELLKYLMNVDQENMVYTYVHNPYVLNEFAPNLEQNDIVSLPEETGVYYLYNEKDEVIYLGKSNFIKDRVLQQLGNIPINKDKRRMYESVHNIAYELTGSELLACLLESYQLKNLSPKFNKRQRPKSKPYGVIKYVDQNGYYNLKVKKLSSEDESVAIFSSTRQAKMMVDNCIAAFRLCPKLCGRDATKSSCINYRDGKCDGACVGKEKASYYNARLEEALSGPQYDNPNFLVISEGRNYSESSVVGIYNGRFYGYGFFEKEKLKNGALNTLKENLQELPPDPDADRIIRSYLNRNKLDRLVVLNQERPRNKNGIYTYQVNKNAGRRAKQSKRK